MRKFYWILFFIIHFINSNPIDEDDCSVCQFDEYHNRSNGYGCVRVNDHQTICTCPDRQLSKYNQPCRICNRPGICGPKSAKCSENSDFLKSTMDGPYFACFCSTSSVVIGNKCPDDPQISSTTMNMTTQSGEITNPSSTSTTKKSSSSSSTCPKCDTRSNSSRLFIQPILIILLNLIHFLNK